MLRGERTARDRHASAAARAFLAARSLPTRCTLLDPGAPMMMWRAPLYRHPRMRGAVKASSLQRSSLDSSAPGLFFH